ncbi:MAG: hypothetical protein V5A38_07680 [Halolamina sp.]|uniref:hypothetical protein n=1 Tax=Halolamina sp. TaxID=1940283 RepID=UPI002FC36BB7
MLALGAPKDSDSAVIEERCPGCGEVTRWESERMDNGEGWVLHCPECGTETTRFSG